MVRNFLISRLTATASSSFTRHKSAQIHLGSLLQHKHSNAFLVFFNSFASDTKDHPKGDTFTVSYLINSCGLSPELARKVSKRMHLKNPKTPNAVIDLFKNYGFSKTHLEKLVVKNPRVLVSKAKSTLLPKLEFLFSIGVSNADMPKLLLNNPGLLRRSLENVLIPRYEILKGILGDAHKVVSVLKRAPVSFTYCGMENHLVPNIKVLRSSCVPQSSISFLMMHFTTVAYARHSRFEEAVRKVKEFGFDPSKTSFVMALYVLLSMNEVTWDSRFRVYERWGWNREMFLQAFRKCPHSLKLSEETITKKMSFLVKDIGLLSEDVAAYPQILAYDLEKRIIPRVSVIKILKLKGLVKNDLHFSTFMGMKEEMFLQKFLINFLDYLPSLLDVYTGLISHKNVI
ncbi:hypothetical protein RJT34_00343 [Clitoria ternatea]|uniref:Uncharacterized protein n=1 Tax=Clitoria ternatea TaxID=43366 RepID=A0AAN9KFW5_CLITE